MSKYDIKRLSEIGKIGGRSRSDKKLAAVRANGKLSKGRPRKDISNQPCKNHPRFDNVVKLQQPEVIGCIYK